MRALLARLDGAVYQVERVLLAVSLAMMTVLVALDVVQRTFSRPEGRTGAVLLALLGEVSPQTRQLIHGTIGPGLFWGVMLALCLMAVQSSRSMAAERAGTSAPRPLHSILIGLLVWAGLVAFVQAVLWLFPTSVPGAQKFALGFMLWSGMLGASLATRARRHIVLDPIVKKLDPKTARPFALVGGVATFAFCALLAVLGFLQLQEQLVEWSAGEGVGVYDALPIPIWITTLSIPFTFTVMALRFLANGVHDFLFGAPKGGVDAHGVDLEALAAEGAKAAP